MQDLIPFRCGMTWQTAGMLKAETGLPLLRRYQNRKVNQTDLVNALGLNAGFMKSKTL